MLINKCPGKSWEKVYRCNDRHDKVIITIVLLSENLSSVVYKVSEK